ncbi:beta-ketoacyl synthase N-terminal-like domain-containing protein [Haliangium sp.]|uniref:beta-ketoacyl synthase N-terminal-like domain-containing protein n=1 Tax=Haliangium sp. TaxID=2663208 RepID=UPI003D0E9E43
MTPAIPSAAITGWAWRTPLGADLDQVMDRLDAGARAAADNACFDAATYACGLAAAIPGSPARSRHARVLRRIGLFGFEAAAEALDRSGRGGGPRLGLFAAVGGLRAHWNDMMPALCGQSSDFVDAWARGLRLIHPFWMLKHLSNNTHALLAQDLGARGDGVTFGGANAGAQALHAATRALADGAVDAAVVVAYDSLIEPETVVEMGARGVLARGGLDTLGAPYDRAGGGQVPGEGAAALVLEPADTAGTRAWALIRATDGGDGGDGGRGLPAARTLDAVLVRLGVARAVGAVGAAAGSSSSSSSSDAAGDAVIVDGAGRADVAFDRAERAAIAGVLGPAATLTAVQAGMGLLGAAAPLIQAMALARALDRGRVYPIAGLRAGAPGPLALVDQARATRAREAVAVCAGAPGLAGAVHVTLP